MKTNTPDWGGSVLASARGEWRITPGRGSGSVGYEALQGHHGVL